MILILFKNEKFSIVVNVSILLFLIHLVFYILLLYLTKFSLFNYLDESLYFILNLSSEAVSFPLFLAFYFFGLLNARMYLDFLLDNDRFNYQGFIDYCTYRAKGSYRNRFYIFQGLFMLILLGVFMVIGLPQLISSDLLTRLTLSQQAKKGLIILLMISLTITGLVILINLLRVRSLASAYSCSPGGLSAGKKNRYRPYTIYKQLPNLRNVMIGTFQKDQLDSELRSLLNELNLIEGDILCLGVSRRCYFIELTYSEGVFQILRVLSNGESCGKLSDKWLAEENFRKRVLEDF